MEGGVKTFVKTLRTGTDRKPIGTDNILIVIFLPEQSQIFLVILMNRDGIGCIFQFDELKITTLSDKI